MERSSRNIKRTEFCFTEEDLREVLRDKIVEHLGEDFHAAAELSWRVKTNFDGEELEVTISYEELIL